MRRLQNFCPEAIATYNTRSELFIFRSRLMSRPSLLPGATIFQMWDVRKISDMTKPKIDLKNVIWRLRGPETLRKVDEVA